MMYADYYGRQINLDADFDKCWNYMRNHDFQRFKRELVRPIIAVEGKNDLWEYSCEKMTGLFNLAVYEDFKMKKLVFTKFIIESYSEYIKSRYGQLWHRNDFDYIEYRKFITKLFQKAVYQNVVNNKEKIDYECSIVKYFTENYSSYIDYNANAYFALVKAVFNLRPDILKLLIRGGASIVNCVDNRICIKQQLCRKYPDWKYRHSREVDKNRIREICILLEKHASVYYKGIVKKICVD